MKLILKLKSKLKIKLKKTEIKKEDNIKDALWQKSKKASNLIALIVEIMLKTKYEKRTNLKKNYENLEMLPWQLLKINYV